MVAGDCVSLLFMSCGVKLTAIRDFGDNPNDVEGLLPLRLGVGQCQLDEVHHLGRSQDLVAASEGLHNVGLHRLGFSNFGLDLDLPGNLVPIGADRAVAAAR